MAHARRGLKHQGRPKAALSTAQKNRQIRRTPHGKASGNDSCLKSSVRPSCLENGYAAQRTGRIIQFAFTRCQELSAEFFTTSIPQFYPAPDHRSRHTCRVRPRAPTPKPFAVHPTAAARYKPCEESGRNAGSATPGHPASLARCSANAVRSRNHPARGAGGAAPPVGRSQEGPRPSSTQINLALPARPKTETSRRIDTAIRQSKRYHAVLHDRFQNKYGRRPTRIQRARITSAAGRWCRRRPSPGTSPLPPRHLSDYRPTGRSRPPPCRTA